MSMPARLIVLLVHRIFPHNKRSGEIVVGIALIISGATIAANCPAALPHALHPVYDGFAWLIHGFGCSPIIEAVMAKIPE